MTHIPLHRTATLSLVSLAIVAAAALAAALDASSRIRRSVIQKKPATTEISTIISVPSHAPTFHASWIPNTTPTGVVTSNRGLAIRTARS
jgi:hypothetical protein